MDTQSFVFEDRTQMADWISQLEQLKQISRDANHCSGPSWKAIVAQWIKLLIDMEEVHGSSKIPRDVRRAQLEALSALEEQEETKEQEEQEETDSSPAT